jgi:hypothetical protein
MFINVSYKCDDIYSVLNSTKQKNQLAKKDNTFPKVTKTYLVSLTYFKLEDSQDVINSNCQSDVLR